MSDVSPCCLKYSFHEGTPKGTHKEIFGLNTYVAGKEGKQIIVCLTDIYGHKFQNMMLLADKLAELSGFYVLVPDILNGDPIPPSGPFVAEEWFPKHGVDFTHKMIEDFISKMKDELKPNFVGAIGYCFGARDVVDGISGDAIFDAGCIAHPSRLDDAALFKNVNKPLLLSAAEIDPMFSVKTRRDVEDLFCEKKVAFQSTLFQGTAHGFAVKGDFTQEPTVYAGNKAAQDHVEWFQRFCK